MTLRLVFLVSIYSLVVFASLLMWYSEESPWPNGLTPLVAGIAFVMNERKQAWSIRGWKTNVLGLVACGAAVGEILGPNIEARLLACAHFITYLTWIVLFTRKSSREYWWLGSFALLHTAVGAVLDSSGEYGALVLAFLVLMLWTMAVSNVYLRTLEFALIDPSDRPNWERQTRAPSTDEQKTLAASPENVSSDHRVHPSGTHDLAELGTSRVDRNGHCQDISGRWISGRFVYAILRMAILGAVVGLAIFLLVPRLWIGSGNPFANTMLAATRAITGNAGQVRLGHLGQILEDPARVFRVRFFDDATDELILPDVLASRLGVDELTFRTHVHDIYLAGEWKVEARGDGVPAKTILKETDEIVRQEYLLEEVDDSGLPAMRPVDQAVSISPVGQLSFDRANQIVFSPKAASGAREYTVRSVMAPHSDLPSLLNADGRPRNARAAARYLSTPRNLNRMRGLADSIANSVPANERNRNQRVADAIIGRLRDSGEYEYSLKMDINDDSIDPIEDFLLNTKRGHCEYYATALALMLRTQSIPSRLVTGYKGLERNALTGEYEVQRRHAHAWVEAWIGNSWKTLDAVPYARDEEVRRFRTNRGFWLNTRDSFSSLWTSYFATLSIDRQQKSFYAPLTDAWESVSGAAMGLFSKFSSSTNDGASRLAMVIAIVIAALIVMRFAFSSAKETTAKNSRQQLGFVRSLFNRLFGGWLGTAQSSHQIVRFYEDFLADLERFGWVRLPSQTHREFAVSVAGQLQSDSSTGGTSSSPLHEFPLRVTDLFYRVRFGEQALDSASLELLAQQHREFQTLLGQKITAADAK